MPTAHKLLRFIFAKIHIFDAASIIALLLASIYFSINDQWTNFALCILSAMVSTAFFLKRPIQKFLKNKFKFAIE